MRYIVPEVEIVEELSEPETPAGQLAVLALKLTWPEKPFSEEMVMGTLTLTLALRPAGMGGGGGKERAMEMSWRGVTTSGGHTGYTD